MCSLPLPCQHGSHHPFLSKDANVIEYLLTVSGKMKNSRKAIALEPLSQLHKKSSRNIPGTFFHNRNSCRMTSPPVNIFAWGGRGGGGGCGFCAAPAGGPRGPGGGGGGGGGGGLFFKTHPPPVLTPPPYLLRWAAISSRYSGRTSKPNSMALSAYSAALS